MTLTTQQDIKSLERMDPQTLRTKFSISSSEMLLRGSLCSNLGSPSLEFSVMLKQKPIDMSGQLFMFENHLVFYSAVFGSEKHVSHIRYLISDRIDRHSFSKHQKDAQHFQ